MTEIIFSLLTKYSDYWILAYLFLLPDTLFLL